MAQITLSEHQMMNNVTMGISKMVMAVLLTVERNIVVMVIVIVTGQTMMASEQSNVTSDQTTVFWVDCVQVPVLFQLKNVCSVMKRVMDERDNTIFSY